MGTEKETRNAIVDELRSLHICDTLEEGTEFAKELGITVDELITHSRLTDQAQKEGMCPVCFLKGKREPALEFCHSWSGMQMISRCCKLHYKRTRRWERNIDLLAQLVKIREEKVDGGNKN